MFLFAYNISTKILFHVGNYNKLRYDILRQSLRLLYNNLRLSLNLLVYLIKHSFPLYTTTYLHLSQLQVTSKAKWPKRILENILDETSDLTQLKCSIMIKPTSFWVHLNLCFSVILKINISGITIARRKNCEAWKQIKLLFGTLFEYTTVAKWTYHT